VARAQMAMDSSKVMFMTPFLDLSRFRHTRTPALGHALIVC
jgi:hypothetical protein